MRFLLASDQRRLWHFFSVRLYAKREAYLRLLKLRLLQVISSKDSSVELLFSTLEKDFDMETLETDLNMSCSYLSHFLIQERLKPTKKKKVSIKR